MISKSPSSRTGIPARRVSWSSRAVLPPAPSSQALAANFAPEDMRGRYMAFFGLSWSIPSIFGSAAAGLILDNLNPNLLWYVAGILCAVAAASYYILHLRLGKQKRFARQPIDKSLVPAD